MSLLASLLALPIALAVGHEPLPGTCDPDASLPGSAWLERLQPGGRPLTRRTCLHGEVVDEAASARVIYDAFLEAGHTPALALAAVVTAWSESSLDAHAIMRDPFTYNGRTYAKGSGALGLFQLLPSPNGAGGPSGVEEGYPRDFQDRRWAGTPAQAAQWSTTPDPRGRRYYDATDPHLNTERILLEIERDGRALLAAERRGASIAELTYLFGRDIERPHHPVDGRRHLAARLLGPELAYAEHPNAWFAPEPSLLERQEEPTCAVPPTAPRPKEPPEAPPARPAGLASLVASALGWPR